MKFATVLSFAACVLGAPSQGGQATHPDFTEHVVTLDDGSKANLHLRTSMFNFAVDKTDGNTDPSARFDAGWHPTQFTQELCNHASIQVMHDPPTPTTNDCTRMAESVAKTFGYWIVDGWDGKPHIMAFLDTCAFSVERIASDKAAFVGNVDVANIVRDTAANYYSEFDNSVCGSQGVLGCTSVDLPNLHFRVVRNM